MQLIRSAMTKRLGRGRATEAADDRYLDPVGDATHGVPPALARLELPVQAEGGALLSVIAALADSPGPPDRALMSLALDAARRAMETDLSHLHERSTGARKWLSVYPGEHYQLLAALVELLAPRTVVDIGTLTGLSALAMLTRLPAGARLTTFDVVPWDRLRDTALRPADFADSRLTQELADLSVGAEFARHESLLRSASLIFIDGPKDGRFEPNFYRRLCGLRPEQPCLVIFDDIRTWNMLSLWRSIELPKLDLTSFGHWSGTGLFRLT